MHRFISKIVEIKEVGERGEGSFRVYTLSLKVRVKDIIPKGLKLPLRIKGRTVWVTREYPHPFEPKPGDEIVLFPQDLRDIIPDTPGDMNRDGFEEVVLKNEWMEVTILPYLGTRISSLVYKGKDYFIPALNYGRKGWVDTGGIFDLIDEDFPGVLWNAEFKECEIPNTKNHRTFRYDKKGVEIVKNFSLHQSLPLLTEKTRITVKRKKDIVYSKYIPISIRDPETVLFVPTEEKLEHRFYQKTLTFTPWRPFNHYGVRFGSFLVGDSKGSLLYATGQEKMEFLRARYTPTSFIIHPVAGRKELKKGESFTYGCIYAIGDEYKVTNESITLRADGTHKSAFLVRGDDKFSGKGRWKDRDIRFTPIEIEDVGKLWICLSQ
jgi:hypothetical protein